MDEHTVVNTTDKTIVYHVDIVNYNVHYEYYDSVNISPKLFFGGKELVEPGICCLMEGQSGELRFIYHRHDETDVDSKSNCANYGPNSYDQMKLYNLTDTTSISLLKGNLANTDSNFVRESEYESSSNTKIARYHLTITDELVDAMRKDTAMLRMFPEYYR